MVRAPTVIIIVVCILGLHGVILLCVIIASFILVILLSGLLFLQHLLLLFILRQHNTIVRMSLFEGTQAGEERANDSQRECGGYH